MRNHKGEPKARKRAVHLRPLADEKARFVCLNGMPKKWWLAAFGLSLGHHCEVPPARVRDDPPDSSAMTDQLD